MVLSYVNRGSKRKKCGYCRNEPRPYNVQLRNGDVLCTSKSCKSLKVISESPVEVADRNITESGVIERSNQPLDTLDRPKKESELILRIPRTVMFSVMSKEIAIHTLIQTGAHF